MINLCDIVNVQRTKCHAPSSTKKSALELISQLLAEQCPELTDIDILTKLIERERLGSTNIGHGVAIPHARMPGLSSSIASFIRLETPISFDGASDTAVDLVFGFIVPDHFTQEHVALIALLATRFNEQSLRDQLRTATTDIELYRALMTEPEATFIHA